jgi:hypothetical protein
MTTTPDPVVEPAPATPELAGKIRRNRHRAQVCRYTFARRPWRLIGVRPTTATEQLVRLERWVRRRRYACTKVGYLNHHPIAAIRSVFGIYGWQAVAVARCESRFNVFAGNGQYLGLFQMGEYARARYGHSWTALGQSFSARAYFYASGRDWSPWQCRPWGLAW